MGWDVVRIDGRIWDPDVFEFVMSLPPGPVHREYKRQLQRYVTRLPEEDKKYILEHQREIVDLWHEWCELNTEVLLRLGFDEGEAGNLSMNRLNSPGMLSPIITGKALEMHGCAPTPLGFRARRVLGSSYCSKWMKEFYAFRAATS